MKNIHIQEACLRVQAKLGGTKVLRPGTLIGYSGTTLVEASAHVDPEFVLLDVGYPGELVFVCTQAVVSFGDDQPGAGAEVFWDSGEYNFAGLGHRVGRTVSRMQTVIDPAGYRRVVFAPSIPIMPGSVVPPIYTPYPITVMTDNTAGELGEEVGKPKRNTQKHRPVSV